MAWYFRKRIKILPWLYLNISKTGISFSIGKRGMSLTANKKGLYSNIGIPGTGVYNRTKLK